jgi:hypothetical protein
MAVGRPMSNATIRVLLDAVEEVMGGHGTKAVLNAGGLVKFVDNFPPKDLEMVGDFSEYGAIQQAVEDFYGRAARGPCCCALAGPLFGLASKTSPLFWVWPG